jgi:hypothetical protein
MTDIFGFSWHHRQLDFFLSKAYQQILSHRFILMQTVLRVKKILPLVVSFKGPQPLMDMNEADCRRKQ